MIFKPPCGRSDDGHLLPVTWDSIVPLRRRYKEQAAEIFLGKWPSTIPASVFTASVYVHVVWIAFLVLTSQFFSHLRCPKLFGDVMRLVRSCWWWTRCWRLHSCVQLQAYCTRGSYDYAITMTLYCEVLADEISADCSQNCQSAKISSHMILLILLFLCPVPLTEMWINNNLAIVIGANWCLIRVN